MWHTYTNTLECITNEAGKAKAIQTEIMGLMAMTMAMTMTANISEVMLMRRDICNPMKRIAIVDDDDNDEDDEDDGGGNER